MIRSGISSKGLCHTSLAGTQHYQVEGLQGLELARRSQGHWEPYQ
jgi:hypothetical protein